MRVLQDKVAVITGAAGGIGAALAMEFARAGMHIVLADVNIAGLSALQGEIAGLHRRALCVTTDVRDPAAIERLLAHTLQELGRCDLLINNAGVFHGAPLLDAPLSQWQRVIDTNLWGVIHGCRVFGVHFAKQGHGHIVNTSSAAGLFPVPGMHAYSTSKFGVVGLTLQLRWELADQGVGVTLLCPGVVNTGIARAEGVGLEHLDLEKAVANAPLPTGLARKTLHAVMHNRPLVRYGVDAYVFSLLRMLPLVLADPLGRLLARKALRVVRGEDTL